ncbi:acyltransferase [Loktanella gaetbuli]|uniref:acyltransferase n=1 Tax=Loktanella gaetbuli TaxID=2881335 RepID=UPI00299D8302|nr:acyltransferase [Loktanella gaetbuli]
MTDTTINRLLSWPVGLASRLRVWTWRRLGMQIEGHCRLHRIRVPRNPWDIALADGVALDDGVVLLTSGARGASPRLTIGARSYVNRQTMFDASERISVGADCMIGPFVYITDHDHGTAPGIRLADQPLTGTPVTIGRNVWIGAGAIILKGVTIGDNAVIAAGCVVTRDVPPGARIAGVPGRPLTPAAKGAP